jgi:SurA N-terminal domain
VFGKPGGRARRAAAFVVICAGACLALAACSSVKFGAAAIVGNQRITASALDTQVSNLQQAAAPYGKQVSLSAADMPAAVLSWLIRFQISDQVAASDGISLTQSQVQAGVADINSQAASAASQEGLSSPTAALLNAGISPQMLTDIGVYQAQELAFAKRTNGGKLPTTTAEGNAVDAKLTKAQCTAAKSLSIQVNPQFGRLDYTSFTVVPAPNTVSQPAGTPSPADTTGLAPAC